MDHHELIETQVCIHIHTYTHACMYMHVHTHTHKHTHTHEKKRGQKSQRTERGRGPTLGGGSFSAYLVTGDLHGQK